MLVVVVVAVVVAVAVALAMALALALALGVVMVVLVAVAVAVVVALAVACHKPFAQPRRQHDKEGACCFQMNKSYCLKVVTRGLLRTPNRIL